MNKVIVLFFFLVSLLLSFFAGLYIGAEKFLLANSSNQAIILSGELRMIRAGNTDDLIALKESELTSEFRYHDAYLNSAFNWLFPEVTQHSERNMRSAVKYRLEHPYEFTAWWGGDATDDMKSGVAEMNRAAERVVEKYK